MELQPSVLTDTQMPMPGGEAFLLVRPSDAIYEVASHPIATGSRARGWLLCLADDAAVKRIRKAQGQLSVLFRDVRLTACKSESIPFGESEGTPTYYPGSGDLLIKPPSQAAGAATPPAPS